MEERFIAECIFKGYLELKLLKRLIFDGVTPDDGILVATKHPDSVKILIQNVNTMKDANGNNYHLEIKTWSELGLDVD